MAAQPPQKASFSLYADLLEPEKQKASSAAISGAPVKYDVKAPGGEEEGAKKKDASLKFQPIKRPQAHQQKAKKSTSSSSSLHKFSSSTVTAMTALASSPEKSQLLQPQQQPSVQQSNFEDWVGDDDEYYFQDSRPKAERGGRKKKKKNKAQERVWDWDDIYDPTLPNNYADYKGSEEQAREIRDWKARLYYRQLKEARKAKDGAYSDEEEERRPRPMSSMFAPPSMLSFAPPSFDEGVRTSRMEQDDEGDDYYPPDALSSNDRERTSYNSPPTFAQASVPDDASGEDAYMRRLRMSGMASTQSPAPPPPPPPPVEEPAPTPPPVAKTPDTDIDAKRAEAAAKIAAFKAKIAGQAAKPAAMEAMPNVTTALLDVHPSPPPPPPPEEEEAGPTISGAPIRYNVPPPTNPDNEDIPIDPTNTRATSTEQPKSSRPGQKGFAERLLKRYGWSKGQGLGASGEGITTAIVAKAEKRKKRSDADGGGWVAPANMGKIVGGKKRKVNPADDSTAEGEEGEGGNVGAMSEVVKFSNMLTGLDVRREVEEKNLMQEIGEEMQGQYGVVERVFIWREEVGGGNEVFVKFTSPLSALRAVRGMDGAVFADNEVQARFWDGGMFERGEFA